MAKLKSKAWWADVAERTIGTMAEVAIAVIGTNTVGVTDIDWVGVASVTAVAGIVMILRALATLKGKDEEVNNG